MVQIIGGPGLARSVPWSRYPGYGKRSWRIGSDAEALVLIDPKPPRMGRQGKNRLNGDEGMKSSWPNVRQFPQLVREQLVLFAGKVG
jgi:hypothetical protein